MNLIRLFTIFTCLIFGSSAWAKNCVKGIPCGRTCIAAWKTCHIDSGYSTAAIPVTEERQDRISTMENDDVDGERYLVVAMNGNTIALKNRLGRVKGWTIFCLGGARKPERGTILEIFPGNLAITSAGDACSIYK